MANPEPGPAGDFFELEFDQRCGLARVIHAGFDRVWMPAVRHPGLGIHPLDGDLDGQLPVAGQLDLAMGTRAWCEGTLELHAEPGAELIDVGKSVPDTGAGCAQNDLFLDPVGSVMQLYGCILRRPFPETQPSVCISTVRRGSASAAQVVHLRRLANLTPWALT